MLTTIARLVAATMLALVLGSGNAAAEAPASVMTVDVEDAPTEVVDVLLDAGFYGDPNDGAERLYSPSTVDVEDAPEWLVDDLLRAGYVGDPTDGAERLYAPIS